MNRVVVTGMGVVSPIGIGVAGFFDGLARGRQGIGEISSFDASTFPTRLAAEVKGFELDRSGLSETEALGLGRDRKSAFGVAAARQAVLNAFGKRSPEQFYEPMQMGLVSASGLEVFDLSDLVPLLDGTTINGEQLVHKLTSSDLYSNYQVPSDLGARVASREIGAKGLYHVNVSACAAGTQALGEAFWAVRDGVCDMVLVGGYDSMINPLGVGGFCMLEAMSTKNELLGAASRPFDKRRDGFVLGEGSAFFVIENHQLATRRQATVLAEIFGYGSTMDAFRVTDPATDQSGAKAAIKGALKDAELGPAQIDYINAHGTGTPKNDPCETAAIKAVFGPRAYEVPVSSTKSQIGHLIGAAGAVEFAAGLFALSKDTIPTTINCTVPDPECDLDYTTEGPRPMRIDTFMSNSFGFGGQNAVIIAGRPRAINKHSKMRSCEM